MRSTSITNPTLKSLIEVLITIIQIGIIIKPPLIEILPLSHHPHRLIPKIRIRATVPRQPPAQSTAIIVIPKALVLSLLNLSPHRRTRRSRVLLSLPKKSTNNRKENKHNVERIPAALDSARVEDLASKRENRGDHNHQENNGGRKQEHDENASVEEERGCLVAIAAAVAVGVVESGGALQPKWWWIFLPFLHFFYQNKVKF